MHFPCQWIHCIPTMAVLAVAAVSVVAARGAAEDPLSPTDEVRATLAAIKRIHTELAPQLDQLMPVRMRVEPELAMAGEEVTLHMTVLAEERPSEAPELFVH